MLCISTGWTDRTWGSENFSDMISLVYPDVGDWLAEMNPEVFYLIVTMIIEKVS